MNEVLAIIGAGQLGSRHLQALAHLPVSNRIYVVDQSEQALQVARERYTAAARPDGSPRVEYAASLESLPGRLDFALVATGSRPRARIVRELLSTKTVGSLVLEKVLFPRISEYSETAGLLADRGLAAWVNCPRRLWDIYRDLKTELAGEPIEMTAHGGDWGMGCNVIHMLDLLAFLSGDDRFTVDLSKLDPSVIASKRQGYYEVTGALTAQSSAARLSAISVRGSSEPFLISISTPRLRVSLNEAEGTAIYERRTGDRTPETRRFTVPFQSQLTGAVASGLLSTGSCLLTPYESSMRLHLALVEPLVPFFDTVLPGNNGNCPIT